MKNDKSFRSFEELDCWNACRELRQYIAKLVKQYPKDEKYRIVDNILRAARSTTHNIAEGFGRFHYQENIQFCRHSRGSLYELKDQIICSLDEGFINDEEYKKCLDLINSASALLNGYINYLKRKKQITDNK
ncbi:MAG: four helix bundle protein [Candidatus Scalinduaceae bacterium]